MKFGMIPWRGLLLIAMHSAASAQIGGSEDLRAMVRSSISANHDGSNGKCGTAFRLAWRAEHLNAPAGVAGVWEDRPLRHVSRLSQSGRFRVHFDTAGVHQPALLDGGGARIPTTADAFVDSVLVIFDRAWEQIVTVHGYDPPPADTAGGDDACDIYLSELPPDWFGQTVLEEEISGANGPARWRTYLEIDNDFAGLRTPGVAGLRITAAHEFFHAVQLGAYGVWVDDDFYFYELASVWMETMLEPGIDDYFHDLPLYFSDFSGLSLATFTTRYRGYERSVFAIFLEERFGSETMRDVWEGVRAERVLPALDRALEARGSGLRSAYHEFAVWNHRTADRAAGTTTYQQASRFPRMLPSAVMTWAPPWVQLGATGQPLSHSTLDLRLPADTFSTIVINTDIVTAGTGTFSPLSVALTATSSPPEEGSQRVGDLWFSIAVPSPGSWSHEVMSASRRDAVPMDAARPWPSPWVLSEEADLLLPIGSMRSPESVAFVSTGQRVTRVERWNLETQRAATVARIPVGPMRDHLATGVYVVVLTQGSEQQLWKIAVVR